MEEIDYNRYEIVGINGAVQLPTVQCARSLPVGHIKGTDNYFLANERFHEHGAEHHSVAKSGLEEIKGYETEMRLTLLAQPMPMVKDAIILYATENRLTSRGFNPLAKPIAVIGGQNIIWQNLVNKGVWITSSNSKTIDILFDRLKS